MKRFVPRLRVELRWPVLQTGALTTLATAAHSDYTKKSERQASFITYLYSMDKCMYNVSMLQNIFYIMAIVFMTLGSVLLIVIAVLLLTLKNKVVDLHNTVDKKINDLSSAVSDPSSLAVDLGTKVARSAVQKVKDSFKK